MLLQRVRSDWISGVLEHSLHEAVLDLYKDLRGEAVGHPWASTAELPDRTRRRLPAGQTITALFEEVGRLLLILGGPGAGKTISLLQLARDLLDRAAADPLQPVPVYFNLSTWTTRVTLNEWLIKEFGDRYHASNRQVRAWMQDQRVILLLDGLDEVPNDSRADCVRAINTFIRKTGAAGIAVGSRTDEYTALPARLTLRGAVGLEPLTREQVEEYLARAGPHLGALREALQSDESLQALASTPLMLSVMSLAYHGLPVEQLHGGAFQSAEARRAHLFTTYVQRMFDRRQEEPASRERTLHWLTWLARGMRQHAESVFLIERLQPDWLLTRAERWSYTICSRALGGAAIGAVLGLSLDLGLLLIEGASATLAEQARELLTRLWFGLALGILDGLMAGVVDGWRFERSLRRREIRSRRTSLNVVGDVVAYVLALGLVGWLVVDRIGGFDDPLTGLVVGVLAGLLFGIIFGLHDSRRGVGDDIRTVEALRWSWRSAWRAAGRGLATGLVAGVVVGALAVLLGGPAFEGALWLDVGIFCVLAGLIGSGVGGLLGASFGGLKRSEIPAKALPNQGITLSVRNAMLSGLLVGGAVGTAFSIVVGLRTGWVQGLNAGLVGALFFGMLAGLHGGMLDVVQHCTLRRVLAARGYAPADYARFLDHAVGLVLLQRAGGSYLFIHRLLLDHLADRETTSAPGAGLALTEGPSVSLSRGAASASVGAG